MTERERKEREQKSRSYKALRDFVKNITDISATELDADVGNAIAKSEKTTQNISRGKRVFTWEEAISAAGALVNLAKQHVDQNSSVALEALTRSFLTSYGPSVGGRVLQKSIDDILGTWFDVSPKDGSESQTVVARYNNLPEFLCSGTVIRENLQQQILLAIDNHKIVYLSGIMGTGKSFLAVSTAQKLFHDRPNDFQYTIWIKCGESRNAVNDVIGSFLTAFGIKNIGNMTSPEKYDLAVEYFQQQKGILILDGLETVPEKNVKEDLLQFITEKISSSWAVFITCNTRFGAYRKSIRAANRIQEIKVEDFTYEEWQVLSKIIENSRSDVKEAKESFPELDQVVYDHFKGNPFVMIHILATLSEKLLTGTSFERIKTEYDFYEIDEDSFQAVFDKTVSTLPENCVIFLVALSLFVTPISSSVIQLVSGIDGVEKDSSVKAGSDLEKSILGCHNLYMIERYLKNGIVYFSLPVMLESILGRVLKERASEFKSIIERWIAYYRSYTEEIGFCFDDFNRLEKLDSDSNAREIENIIHVLKFCETMERWEDFYEISENTKYFFYTRGISGEGEESIHYKRACAARRLGRGAAEFNSLLYHCNVMCKARTWKGLDSCFGRLDELLDAGCEIPERDREKYKYLKALYEYSTGKYESALTSFEQYEEEIRRIMDSTNESEWDKFLTHDYIASLRWHCECILALFPTILQEEMQAKAVALMNSLLDEAIHLSQNVNFERAIVHSLLIKIRICQNRGTDANGINEIFTQLDAYRSVIDNDAVYRRQYAQYQRLLKGGGN